MPPYEEYKFNIKRFSLFVNGDIYGIYGKGTYSIKKDTLILKYTNVEKEDTVISIQIDTTKQNEYSYNFKIISKHKTRNKQLKDALIDAKVILYSNDSIINKGLTGISGELKLTSKKAANKIKISHFGYNDLIITNNFSYNNNIYIEIPDNWLKTIEACTVKFKIIDKKRNIIILKNMDNDTITLIRKNEIRKIIKRNHN